MDATTITELREACAGLTRPGGSAAGVVKYWWQKPKMEDGDDMLKDPLEQEGKEIGITLNAAGSGILLQLGEVPPCHKCELHQIRVTLNRTEAMTLKHKLERLIGCLPEPPNEQAQRPRTPWLSSGQDVLERSEDVKRGSSGARG